MRVNLFRSLKRVDDAIAKVEALPLTDVRRLILGDLKELQTQATIKVLELAFVKEA